MRRRCQLLPDRCLPGLGGRLSATCLPQQVGAVKPNDIL